MVEELAREDVTDAIDRAVKELLTAARVVAPPVDALSLAHVHLALPAEPTRRSRSRRAVESSLDATPERRQWEAALRIGDHLKPDILRRLGISAEGPRPMMGESLSRLFAERLLLPRDWFTRDAQTAAYDLPSLGEVYTTVSPEAIAWRLLDLPEPCVITIIDGDRVVRRRGNAWTIRKSLTAAEQECRSDVNRSGRPRTVRSEGWIVQGWPVDREDGLRIVLRSVREES